MFISASKKKEKQKNKKVRNFSLQGVFYFIDNYSGNKIIDIQAFKYLPFI